MNVGGMLSILRAKGVRVDAVSVGVGVPNVDEKYCIVECDDGWEVYYAERGQKIERETFESETEACAYLIAVLNSDSTVWRS